MWPQGAFPCLPGTPGYLQSDKGHGLGSGNLVEKYLSYNKIGNLVSFSSIPQITPSHPPRYNNLPFAMKHNLRDFYIWLFRHLILKNQHISRPKPLRAPAGSPVVALLLVPSAHHSRHTQILAHLMPHSHQKLNGTTRTCPGSTIYPVSPPHCSPANPNPNCATQDLHGVKPSPWSVPKTWVPGCLPW